MITETFKTVLSDGTEVDLVPNGREKVVTFAERNEYAKLVIEARLNESREQILAMRCLLDPPLSDPLVRPPLVRPTLVRPPPC